MLFYNTQRLDFEWESEWGLKTTVGLKTEENEAAGRLFFIPLSGMSDANKTLVEQLRDLDTSQRNLGI
jgi:hypothetical protein